MRRGIWFAAGAACGVYATVRARRAVEAFTPDGIRDRLSGLGAGAHVFGDELRTGMAEKETQLRERLGHALDETPALTGSEPRAAGGELPSSAPLKGN